MGGARRWLRRRAVAARCAASEAQPCAGAPLSAVPQLLLQATTHAATLTWAGGMRHCDTTLRPLRRRALLMPPAATRAARHCLRVAVDRAAAGAEAVWPPRAQPQVAGVGALSAAAPSPPQQLAITSAMAGGPGSPRGRAYGLSAVGQLFSRDTQAIFFNW